MIKCGECERSGASIERSKQGKRNGGKWMDAMALPLLLYMPCAHGVHVASA